jgi:hypothetical protein
MGLLLAGLGALAILLRAKLHQIVDRFAAGRIGPGGVVAAGLLVVAWYFPTLHGGYFRYDDFELLTVAQDQAFWTSLWQPHGDHVMPLTRVLAWVGLKLFGVAAWPYNLWLWFCLGGVLVAGMLLLGEMGVSRPAQWIFVTLVVFWSPWAEMMTGYYILSTYLLIALLGLTAAWLYLRWRRCGRTGDVAALAGCILLAPLIDVSGCYVIGIGGVFLGLDLAGRAGTEGFRSWLIRHRFPLGALLVAVVAVASCLLYAYQVVNPGVFLGMAGEESRSLVQLVRDLAYLFSSGTLLSMVTPFVYARLPGGLLGGLTIAVLGLWLVFFIAALRSATQPRRLMLGAILLVVLGTGLMVCLGRPTSGTWVVRWAAKHICPVYLWLCLFVVAGWDTLWLKLTSQRRRTFAELTVVGLMGFVAAQTAFGLLGMAVAFPPFGYPAEIRDAGRRRAAVERLRDDVVGMMAKHLGDGGVIPTLDGNYLKATCPSLFSYNLSHYSPFFGHQPGRPELVRNPAMQTWHATTVRTVPVLREAVSPALPRLLADDPVLRSYYFAEVPLEARSLAANRPPGGTRVESDGSSIVSLRAEAWDPEVLPRLQLAAEDRDAAGNLTVTVVFWSELLQADWRGTVALSQIPGQTTEVDLRQVYAFALSPRVANLRVILPEPGRYWFRLAEAAP